MLRFKRNNIQSVQRALGWFILKSGFASRRRDNLFRSVTFVGPGLSRFFVRQLVSRFFFLRDQAHPFIRIVIQTHLADYLATLVVSCYDEPTPKPNFRNKLLTPFICYL